MKNHFATRLAAISLALLAGWPAAQADELTATATGALVGSTATLTLQFTTLSALSIGGVSFDFSWAAAGLSFDRAASVALGRSLPALVALGDPDPNMTVETETGGTYTLSSFLSAPLALSAGTQTLTLKFLGMSTGTYDMATITVELLNDQFATAFTAGGFSTPITISPIPEPQPALMLLAGLAAVGWLARRRAV